MSRPTWARWVTRISLVLALVALALTIRDIGLATIGTYFRRIGWWWIAVVIFEVAITTLDATAIRAFLSPEQRKVTLRQALLSQLAGRAINVVTPTGNLGEAVKVSVLVEHVSHARAVSTILLYNAVSFSVELLVVAVAVPFLIVLVPMPPLLSSLMIITCAVSSAIVLGLYVLIRRGALTMLAPILEWFVVRLTRLWRAVRKMPGPAYVLPPERSERLQRQLRDIADKMRLSSGARRRDRWLGIAAVVTSRLASISLSLLILHAVGEAITPGFVAAFTVGGFIIYMVSTLVPMGLGISEGGNYALFRALGENPARGVTLVLARRVTLIMYAAIGVVLVTANETVRRARERQIARAAASGSIVEARDVREVRIVTAAPQVAPAPVTKAAD
jgi:Lysylphosphatidylglycerol synthase TM region